MYSLLLVPGDYTQWTEWSVCNKSCGGGQQKRDRPCTNPSPEHGGQNCVGQGLGPAEEIISCNEQPCPSKKRWTCMSVISFCCNIISDENQF